ncbi:hypothetical protein T01_12059 [Trichinella spiralis]|uniref:Uncharacterized protein n=1 Tax=Trichinella spiralis TaxID=6334 RepID=A0A0V1B882_TRISP|nr:hypothetical protein T01_12059 [Trichinella spiralis]
MEILLLPLVIYFTRTNKTFQEVHESSRTFEQVTEKDSVGRTIKPTVLLLDSGFVGPSATFWNNDDNYGTEFLLDGSDFRGKIRGTNSTKYSSNCILLEKFDSWFTTPIDQN